jgi:ectoine hydroxylase-related dioxygenase (phytanoyl-CoA dioxygenase family)
MTEAERVRAFSFLDEANAESDGIDEKWAASNEQWWDWYLSLAHDDGCPTDPPLPVPPLPELSAPSLPELEAELDTPYSLLPEAIEAFRAEGYVKLKDVCSPASLLLLRRTFEELFARALARAPAMRFPSLEMMWTTRAVARAFVMSHRLARLAAELLGVHAVRLYHDNALSKLPGCGRTPWHYDAHHYPIASENVVTAWVPLQPTPEAMGPLAFARGIETWRRVADLPFSKFDDSYDRGIAEALRDGAVAVDDGPFELGEVSFHHTRSLHTAGPNRTALARMALATTYLEDGARLVDSPTLISGDFEKFMPGVKPGDPIASRLNPILYDGKAVS